MLQFFLPTGCPKKMKGQRVERKMNAIKLSDGILLFFSLPSSDVYVPEKVKCFEVRLT